MCLALVCSRQRQQHTCAQPRWHKYDCVLCTIACAAACAAYLYSLNSPACSASPALHQAWSAQAPLSYTLCVSTKLQSGAPVQRCACALELAQLLAALAAMNGGGSSVNVLLAHFCLYSCWQRLLPRWWGFRCNCPACAVEPVQLHSC